MCHDIDPNESVPEIPESFEQLVRAALDDPVPGAVVAAGEGLFAWRTIDAELAELVHSAAAEPELAGVRSDELVLTSTYESDTLTVELEETPATGELVGQLMPPQHATVAWSNPAGDGPVVEASSQGVFRFADLPDGPFQLVVTRPDGTAVRTAWTTR